MKLAVSTLAWSAEEAPEAAALLRACGVTGIELAPTSVWGDWSSALAAGPADLPAALQGFTYPAMQSLAFNLPDHKVFSDAAAQERLVAHLARVFGLAGRLGARALVFGSPRNRHRGDLSPMQAAAAYGAFAARVAPLAAAEGVLFCLEANPVSYGCDFVTGTEELLELFLALRRPGLGLHFDAGTAAVNGEDLPALIRRAGSMLDHVHISEPRVGQFGAPAAHHAAIAAALREIGYANWVSIEMLRGPNGPIDLEQALRFVCDAYFAPSSAPGELPGAE